MATIQCNEEDAALGGGPPLPVTVSALTAFEMGKESTFIFLNECYTD